MNDETLVCRCCGKQIEEMVHVVNTDAYVPLCEECLKEENIITCTHCGLHYDKDASLDHAHFDEDNDAFYCTHCMGNHFLICHLCGAVEDRNFISFYDTYEYGEVAVCDVCYDNTSSCESCNRVILDSGHLRTSSYGETICGSCHERESNRDEDYDEDCDDDNDNGCRDGKCSLVTDVNTFDKCMTHLTYGVELETSHINKDNDHTWQKTTDGSISGMEFVSPILNGDKGFTEIEAFLNRIDADYDKACGYHVHLGLPNTKKCSPLTLAKILRAYKKLEVGFFSCVNKERIGIRYCKALPKEWTEGNTNSSKIVSVIYRYKTKGELSAEDIISIFDKDKYNDARYYWVNPHSVFYRGTLEIRSHQGTLDYAEITNWISLHGSFIEWCIKSPAKEVYERIGMASKSADNFISFIEKVSGRQIAEYYGGSIKDRWKATSFLMKYEGIDIDVIVSNRSLMERCSMNEFRFETLGEDDLLSLTREHTVNEVTSDVNPTDVEPTTYETQYGPTPINFNWFSDAVQGIRASVETGCDYTFEELEQIAQAERMMYEPPLMPIQEVRANECEPYHIRIQPEQTDPVDRLLEWVNRPVYWTEYGLVLALEMGTEIVTRGTCRADEINEFMLSKEREGHGLERTMSTLMEEQRRALIGEAFHSWGLINPERNRWEAVPESV